MITTSGNGTAIDLFCQATNEQLDHVERVTDCQTGEDFYIVRDGDEEYHVKDLKTCTCGSPNCLHIVLAIVSAHEQEVASALIEIEQSQAILDNSASSEKDRERADYILGQARKTLEALGLDLVNQIKLEVRLGIENGTITDLVCDVDGCDAVPDRFDENAIEFRCKDH